MHTRWSEREWACSWRVRRNSSGWPPEASMEWSYHRRICLSRPPPWRLWQPWYQEARSLAETIGLVELSIWVPFWEEWRRTQDQLPSSRAVAQREPLPQPSSRWSFQTSQMPPLQQISWPGQLAQPTPIDQGPTARGSTTGLIDLFQERQGRQWADQYDPVVNMLREARALQTGLLFRLLWSGSGGEAVFEGRMGGGRIDARWVDLMCIAAQI